MVKIFPETLGVGLTPSLLKARVKFCLSVMPGMVGQHHLLLTSHST